MSANGMAKFVTGDIVKVFDVNGKRNGQPEGGWQGQVTKVGKKLVTVKYNHSVDTFRIETGFVNDRYGHQYILTLEEYNEKQLATKARSTLIREFGIDVTWSKLSGTNLTLLLDAVRRLMDNQQA